MPTLNQLNVNQNAGRVILALETNPVIEPISGPISIDKLMDRFPEQVYTRSKDSHLYKFVTVLCGEVGMGMLKKNALLARLKNEAGLITFNDIDAFYGSVLDFKRLKREIYTYNPEDDALEKEVWDKINAMDASYKKRVVLYLQSTRYGNAPRGIELAAEAASGMDVEVIENYKYLFDRLSDDPLGIQRVGNTEQHEEFVIIPQAIDNRHNVDQTITLRFSETTTAGYVDLMYADLPAQITFGDTAAVVRETLITSYIDLLKTYEVIADANGNTVGVDEAVSPHFFSEHHVSVVRHSEFEYDITIHDPNVNIFNFTVVNHLTNGEPELIFPINPNFYIAKFAGPNPLYINAVKRAIPITDELKPWRAGNVLLIEPEVERNVVRVVDKIRPVNTVMTVKAQPQTHIRVPTNKVQASSEHVNITRFVTGKSDVLWPNPGNASTGTFLFPQVVNENGDRINVEREATTLAYGARAIPVIYHTVEGVAAYNHDALADPAYDTASFFGGPTPAYERYRSLTHAPYSGYTRTRFPSLVAQTDGDDVFYEYFALAKPNTPLVLGT